MEGFVFGILRYVNLGRLRKSCLRLVDTINTNLHVTVCRPISFSVCVAGSLPRNRSVSRHAMLLPTNGGAFCVTRQIGFEVDNVAGGGNQPDSKNL